MDARKHLNVCALYGRAIPDLATTAIDMGRLFRAQALN
jgi:hypothetical protein